jgi:predicted transcriptional regulator
MSTLTVRIDSRLKDELKKISEAEHVAVSDLVRESLRKYVLVKKFRGLRSTVLPLAEAEGYLTDEDIFGNDS